MNTSFKIYARSIMFLNAIIHCLKIIITGIYYRWINSFRKLHIRTL